MDTQVDNQATLNAWHGRGPRSLKLNEVARSIFHDVISKNWLSQCFTFLLDLTKPMNLPAVCLIVPRQFRVAGTLYVINLFSVD